MYTLQSFIIILDPRQKTQKFVVHDNISADFQNIDTHMENTVQNWRLHVQKQKFLGIS